MIPLYTTSNIREMDYFAIHSLGVPGVVLMENAAIGIIDAMDEKLDLHSNAIRIGIVCGKGNNGGDGYAVARHLSNLGHKIKVITFGSEKDMSDDCKINYNILNNLASSRQHISIKKYKSFKDLKFLSDSHIVVDAILGTGVTGELKSPLFNTIKYLNSLPAIRLAIDIPTGLNADTGHGKNVFNSDYTVTLGDYKRGLFIGDGSEFSGEVILKEIGIGSHFLRKFSVQDYLIEPEDIYELLPVKGKSINKYTAGKVFIIAGSGKYPGAAELTSLSSFRSGAGAVVLAFPESPRKMIQKKLTEIVFETYDSDFDGLTTNAVKNFKDKINWADVLAVGPGIDRNPDTMDAVLQLLKACRNKPLVIDADGLYALRNGAFRDYNLSEVILTPHLGEFSNMIDLPVAKLKEDLLSYGKGFSIQTGSYLVLKGSPTIIFTPKGEALVNTSGNPGMAKFGTGDVLTGMIASFIAQTKNIESGILLGVYLHSLSADLLVGKQTEFSLTAGDIIKNIPDTINFIRNSFARVS
jgi:ADP-dependent NAD(P)H-hydrate dehydratase / NAD(P)H-hydrate epimerase